MKPLPPSKSHVYHHVKGEMPKKKIDKVMASIVRYVQAGNGVEPAAAASGITVATFQRWLERGEREPDSRYGQFLAEVMEASAKTECIVTGWLLQAGKKDWRALLAWLQHGPARSRWGKSLELRGSETSPVAVRHVVEWDLGLDDPAQGNGAAHED